MGVVIGIDVGGSTTKIVGFRQEKGKNTLVAPLFVRATDPITSIYGAFGKFIDQNGFALSDIERVRMTGVGSSYITKPIYDLPCETVPEFRSIGVGGLYLSGLSRATVVSMGTGTALVYAEEGKEPEYLGGTGVGGGTLVGLSKKFLGPEDHVLLIDDFLANGCALLGLIDIVKKSGATLEGAGIVIEKGFQNGGQEIRDMGIRLESLAIVDSMTDDSLTFRE